MVGMLLRRPTLAMSVSVSDQAQGAAQDDGGSTCGGNGSGGCGELRHQSAGKKSDALRAQQAGRGDGDSLTSNPGGNSFDEFGDDLDLVASEGAGQHPEQATDGDTGGGQAQHEGQAGCGGKGTEQSGPSRC